MFIETIISDAMAAPSEARRPPSAIAGVWANRLGSTMHLTVDGDHRLHGSFRSGVGTPGGDTSFPLVGYVEGDAVAFCVDFGRFGSVASWTGHHVAGEKGEGLTVLWHLAQPVDGPPQATDVWRSLLAGANEFHRIDE